MNHEQRINQLEKQVERLIKVINSTGLTQEFIPLTKAAKQLQVNPWVIRDRVKRDKSLELGKHYQLNGRCYLINVKQWQKLIASDARAKQM